MTSLDHSSHKEFYDYYARVSQTPETFLRFRALRDAILRVGSRHGLRSGILEVADVGCGAGTQSLVWAELGHKVHALDINQPLLELARQRAKSEGFEVDFRLGSSTKMPWPTDSIDICIVLELLEHVQDWQGCVKECARIVRSNGVLFITTTNKLCPLQNEFNLPLYSWYPGRLKRHFEKLAATTRRDLANYATYPAVNWFTFYSLRDALARYGFSCLDRFDVMNLEKRPLILQRGIALIKVIPALRWLAHLGSQGTLVLAVKGNATDLSE